MATPAFRALRNKYPEAKIDIAVQPVLRNSGFLDNCPYFDSIYTIHNPWFSNTLEVGNTILQNEIEKLVDFENYQEVKWVRHRQQGDDKLHKVYLTAKELSVELKDDTSYEVFINENEEKEALKWLELQHLSSGDYAFMHIDSSDKRKNIGIETAANNIPVRFKDKSVIVGRSFDISKHSIGFAIALLKHAGFILLVDSVFVHCADALGKDIDVHLTNDAIMEVNRPLHIRCKNIIKKEFTNSGYRKQLIRKKLLKARSGFYTNLRKIFYLMGLSTLNHTKKLSQDIMDAVGSLEKAICILVIGVDVLLQDYTIRTPSLLFFYSANNKTQYLMHDTAIPIPFNGIDLLRSKGVSDSSIREVAENVKMYADILINKKQARENVFVLSYDLEKEMLETKELALNESLAMLLQSHEPFLSDKDIDNFSKYAFKKL